MLPRSQSQYLWFHMKEYNKSINLESLTPALNPTLALVSVCHEFIILATTRDSKEKKKNETEDETKDSLLSSLQWLNKFRDRKERSATELEGKMN